jgi:hypothetical protein
MTKLTLNNGREHSGQYRCFTTHEWGCKALPIVIKLVTSILWQ